MDKEKHVLYPTTIVIQNDISNGITKSNNSNELIDSRNAIQINISINRSDYSINDVITGINEVFQKVLECFDK